MMLFNIKQCRWCSVALQEFEQRSESLLGAAFKGVAHRMRSAAPCRAMSLKFEHIVFYVCTHTGGVIRRLSAAPSNDSGRCSNSCRATERHRHCFILNNIIFVRVYVDPAMQDPPAR